MDLGHHRVSLGIGKLAESTKDTRAEAGEDEKKTDVWYFNDHGDCCLGFSFGVGCCFLIDAF